MSHSAVGRRVSVLLQPQSWPVLPRTLLWVAIGVILLIVPTSADPYVNLQLTLIVVYAVAIRGLDVVTGHAGQVSLAQGAFFGIGAYGGAYCLSRDWSEPVSFLVAALVSGVVGALFAIPAVRLRGFAFGMITLALPVLAVPLAVRLYEVTGGREGLAVSTPDAPAWTGLAADQWRYYLVLVIGAIVLLGVHNLLRGRIGRALTMVRTNETLATSLGIPVQRYKILAFTASAMCGGIAGWLYLIPVGFVTPDSLQFTLSISILVALVIGGVRSVLGCVIGSAFYVLVPNLTDSSGQSLLYFGAAVLVVLVFVPNGVAGALRSLAALRLPWRTDRTTGTTGTTGTTSAPTASARPTKVPTQDAPPETPVSTTNPKERTP